MAFLQWRRFTFFEKEMVKNPDSQIPFDKLNEFEIVVCTAGRGRIICGDAEGNIHIISLQLETFSFKAYDRNVSHLHQMRQNDILISIGEDEMGVNPLIKIWNMNKMDRHGNPYCLRVDRALPKNIPTHVTAVAVSDNMTNMAVGFHNGSVMFYKGDITRNRHNKSKILHEGQQPITGLVFRNTGNQNHLFVVTTSDIYSYNLSAKDRDQQFHVDSIGCPAGCVTITDSKHDNHLVVALKEAIYFYQPDGRGPCLGFEGEKMSVHWFRSNCIVIGKDNKNSVSHPSTSSNVDMNVITIYDVQNKLIAYSAPIPAVISVITELGSSIYILCKDNKLYQLQERDTQSKLETLFKKNLYSLAIQVAKSQQYDDDGLVEIFRQYGDHLYSKGDHDGAIGQYIKTIGKLEASYVIRKFLDAQRIHNLTAYLQALHKKGLATEDHTTLLLNCYTKLKDISKLDEFIMTKDREIDFDVDIAIKVCRQAGYFKHALFLAEKHQQHDWYLRIQLEDQKDYNRALEYIGKLEFHEAEQNMKKYGKILLNEVPENTTDFLKRLCTDYTPNDKPLVDPSTLDGSRNVTSYHSSAEDFIHIFVNNTFKLTEFLEHMTKVQPNCQSAVYNTLMEVYLREFQQKKEINERRIWEQKIMDMLQQPASGYDIDQALVLCQVSNFKPGILFLYEKAKLYQQILRYHMDLQDYSSIILTCKKFGSQDQQLWIQALRYFAADGADQLDSLNEVLQAIEKKKLLPPLMVIDILASSPTISLGAVKDYMIRQLQQENSQIAEDERLIRQYREETEKMRNHIEEIKTSARIFQVSKCSACNHQLELPSVHFLCQHSYHQHCFESYADGESECIVCQPENKKVMDIIKSQEQSRDLHEQFHHQLERAEDAFSVVAEYFGRSVFNNVTLIPETLPLKQKIHMPELMKLKVEPKNLNPFDEYDSRLNPFEN